MDDDDDKICFDWGESPRRVAAVAQAETTKGKYLGGSVVKSQ